MSDISLASLPVSVDDICVEVVGGESRFWLVSLNEKGKPSLRMIAKSYVYLRQRVIHRLSADPKVIGAVEDAQDLTAARLYSHKDRASGAQIVRKYFPGAKVIHFFYSGHGPSGTYWWGDTSKSHYSIAN